MYYYCHVMFLPLRCLDGCSIYYYYSRNINEGVYFNRRNRKLYRIKGKNGNRPTADFKTSNISDDEFSKADIKEVLQLIKNEKIAGVDRIKPKMLKYVDEESEAVLLKTLNTI